MLFPLLKACRRIPLAGRNVSQYCTMSASIFFFFGGGSVAISVLALLGLLELESSDTVQYSKHLLSTTMY